MGRPATSSAEVFAMIVGARRVGAPLRQCAQAAGVPWRTFCDWLKAGRDGDARYATLAQECDAAGAQVDTVLHARVMKGTEKDPRLALDVIKYRDAARARTAELRLLKARGTVEEKRATGDHVDRVEVRNVSELTDAELIAEAERLRAELSPSKSNAAD